MDFTLLSRYYATRPLDQVPSIYVDLQLPRFNARKRFQPNLLLRVPVYAEDREGIGKVDRRQLIDESAVELHQLPFLYHFDMSKHRYPPSKIRCTDEFRPRNFFLQVFAICIEWIWLVRRWFGLAWIRLMQHVIITNISSAKIRVSPQVSRICSVRLRSTSKVMSRWNYRSNFRPRRVSIIWP